MTVNGFDKVFVAMIGLYQQESKMDKREAAARELHYIDQFCRHLLDKSDDWDELPQDIRIQYLHSADRLILVIESYKPWPSTAGGVKEDWNEQNNY